MTVAESRIVFVATEAKFWFSLVWQLEKRLVSRPFSSGADWDLRQDRGLGFFVRARTSLLRSAAASLASTRAAMSSAGNSCLSRRIFSRLGSGERAGGDPKGPGVSGLSMPPSRSSSSRCGLSDEPRSNETPRSRFSFLPWIASLSAAGARTRTGTPTGAMSERRLRFDAVGAPKGLPRGRDVQVRSGFIATRVKFWHAGCDFRGSQPQPLDLPRK